MSGISRRALLRGTAAAIVAAPAAAAVIPVRYGIYAGLAQGGVPGIGQAQVPAATISWAPSEYLDDDYVSHVTDSPSEWLEKLDGGGHRLLGRHGDPLSDDDVEPEALAPLVDGGIVKIDRYEDFGTAELTVNLVPDDDEADFERFTCSREWPKGAEFVMVLGEPEESYCSLRDLGEWLEPGDTATVRFYAWTLHRFVYRAATGTLEPVDPASLIPPMISEGPQPELPLDMGATDA